MCSHGHSHGSGGCSGQSEEFQVPQTDQFVYDLQRHIIFDNLEVLNELSEGSGRTVFRPHETRDDRFAVDLILFNEKCNSSTFVESDDDEQLLFQIPFSGHVRISGICVAGPESDQHPGRIKLFVNRPNMTFADVSVDPAQEILLKQDEKALVDYPLKQIKFCSVSHLTIFVENNFGADRTKIFYIGLRGERVGDFRQKVVIATYEARAIPQDHKGEIPDGAQHSLY